MKKMISIPGAAALGIAGGIRDTSERHSTVPSQLGTQERWPVSPLLQHRSRRAVLPSES